MSQTGDKVPNHLPVFRCDPVLVRLCNFGAPEFYAESGWLIRTPFPVRYSGSPRRQLAIKSSQDVIQGII